MATPPPTQDYYEVSVKAKTADGTNGDVTSVEVTANVIHDGSGKPFEKAHELYKAAKNFVLWNTDLVLDPAYLKLHVFDDSGFHAEVVILDNTGESRPEDSVPVPVQQ